MPATHIDDKNFDQSLSENSGTVLIDFWAPWCGPCRAMGGIVDELADEVGETATVVKANVDESPEAAQKFGIQSIPTFVVVKDGEVKERFSGVVTKQRLLDAIQPSAN